MGKITKNAKNKILYKVVKTETVIINKLGLRLGDCCDLVYKHPEVFYVECNNGNAKMRVYDYNEIVNNCKC